MQGVCVLGRPVLLRIMCPSPVLLFECHLSAQAPQNLQAQDLSTAFPAGPAFGDFAEPVFERCLRIASSQVAEKSQQVVLLPFSQAAMHLLTMQPTDGQAQTLLGTIVAMQPLKSVVQSSRAVE